MSLKHAWAELVGWGVKAPHLADLAACYVSHVCLMCGLLLDTVPAYRPFDLSLMNLSITIHCLGPQTRGGVAISQISKASIPNEDLCVNLDEAEVLCQFPYH